MLAGRFRTVRLFGVVLTVVMAAPSIAQPTATSAETVAPTVTHPIVTKTRPLTPIVTHGGGPATTPIAPSPAPAATVAGPHRPPEPGPDLTEGGSSASSTSQVTSRFPTQQCCGGGNNWNAGEPSLAVGDGYILETVNSSETVYSTSTYTQLYHADFGTEQGGFFQGHTLNGSCIDPTDVYLQAEQKFGIGCSVRLPQGSTAAQQLIVTVSITPNPGATWCTYTINPTNFEDFESITASSDKIVVSGYSSGSTFSEFWVFQKSDVLKCNQTTPYYFLDSQPTYRAVVQEGTPVSDVHYVSFHAGSADADLMTITGTPKKGNVNATSLIVGSAPGIVEPFPDPAIPGGFMGQGTIDGGILNAVEEQRTVDNHRVIAISSTQQCTSGHGHLCGWLNYIDLNVLNNSGNPYLQFFASIDYSYYGIDATYPAVALDGYGNFYATYSYSSGSATPSAVVSGFNPAGGSLWTPVIIYGNTPNTTACVGSAQPPCDERWGDYNGAAQDGSLSGTVWFGSLYQNNSGQFGWGSVITHATSSRVGD